ncbi:MAG TPA: WecB/TagA/CpsF family glycosyltransferase [Microlunatus sp.]
MTFDAPTVTAGLRSLDVDGTAVHLIFQAQAVEMIVGSAEKPRQPPLAVASINLDHVHHLGHSNTGVRFGLSQSAEWLNLIDGAPLARQARRVTGVSYPRLSGSDLVLPILDAAERRGLAVGIIGGLPEVRPLVADEIGKRWPKLRLVGHWTPSRADLHSAEAMGAMTDEIHEARADILLVCLGKPRQESWINAYGVASGAKVLLAFGAVVDFLAGRVARAPRWVASAGFEWAWRLMLEPRRLAPRYLIQGPPAYVKVRRSRALRDVRTRT